MGADLALTVSNRYSVVAMIFFVGYILIDLASTIIMKKFSASLMIPTVCLVFGILTLGQGFIKHWGELALCRILLGIFEGAFLPAALFLLQVWYCRFEFQKRQAAFYVVGTGSSGLSGLLAFAIEKMDGIGGLEGWRWIFIIVSIPYILLMLSRLADSPQEGIASCVAAIMAYFVLVDLPEDGSSMMLVQKMGTDTIIAAYKNKLGMPAFLSKEDAAVLLAHIERDRGDAQTEKFGWKDMLYTARDWRVWEFGLYVLLNVCGISPLLWKVCSQLARTFRSTPFLSFCQSYLTKTSATLEAKPTSLPSRRTRPVWW